MLDDRVLDDITRTIRSLADSRRVVLFGSQAAGAATGASDLDILVVVGDDVSELNELGRSIHIAIGELTALPCDIVVEHESTFHARSELPTIERTIAQTGRTLYAA